MRKSCLTVSIFILALLACQGLRANQVPIRLYINAGTYQAIDGTLMPALAFNSSSTYSPENTVISILPGDSILLTLINTDTATHGLGVGPYPVFGALLGGDSATTLTKSWPAGLYIYHDAYLYPRYAYMGAVGMLHVMSGNPDHRYHWNIHEFQTSFNNALAAQQTVDWMQFYPDFFTVNGRSYPDTELDASARIMGAVGDTIHVQVANTGRAVHSMHFHGYHFRILYSSKSAVHLNWIKDSMPIHPMQTMILELVPDKPGMYPVHDHNLLSLSGGGIYPNGLMMMIDIQ